MPRLGPKWCAVFKSADAEFDSERNHRHIREKIGAESTIPAKRAKASWKLHGVRAAFPAEGYRPGVHAETLFSAIKRKLSAKHRLARSPRNANKLSWLGLAYNLYRLWRRQTFQRQMRTA